MKIKTYQALNVPEAMNQIRQDFGNNAVILSNTRTLDGVRITIGIEDDISDFQIQEALFGTPQNQFYEKIQKILRNHSTPSILIERILNALPNDFNQNETQSLSSALDKVFQFSPLTTNDTKRAFILVGPSGSGKTIAVAKMAVKAKIKNKKIAVITTDIKRAGAIDQLEAFTKILDLDLIKVRKADLLKDTVNELRTKVDLILIDSPGINPFSKEDTDLLKEMTSDIVGLEPILVLSAGMDAYESADIASIFLHFGCHRLLSTRLDLSKRFGNILWAAQSNGYSLTDVGISGHVSEALCPLKALSLAQLLLLDTKKGDAL